MTETKWVEGDLPGHPGRGGTRWEPLLEPLRTRVGVWAELRRYETSGAAQNARTYLRRFIATQMSGEWEFTARRNGAGAILYGRYLGEES